MIHLVFSPSTESMSFASLIYPCLFKLQEGQSDIMVDENFLGADFLLWGEVLIRVSGLAGTFCYGIRFVPGGRFCELWRDV